MNKAKTEQDSSFCFFLLFPLPFFLSKEIPAFCKNQKKKCREQKKIKLLATPSPGEVLVRFNTFKFGHMCYYASINQANRDFLTKHQVPPVSFQTISEFSWAENRN